MKKNKYPIPVLLAGLPKGIAEKACEYAEKDPDYWDYFLSPIKNGECTTLSDAVLFGFSWLYKKESHKYWLDLYELLEKNKI